MDDKRKQILVDYISYLYTTGRSYDSIGKYIKYVTDFLENSEEINRRGYYKYKHKIFLTNKEKENIIKADTR